MTHVADEWTRGNYPRSFNFDPTGEFLYCCNQRADNVAIFKVNKTTGELVFTGNYAAVGNPSIIVFHELAGARSARLRKNRRGLPDISKNACRPCARIASRGKAHPRISLVSSNAVGQFISIDGHGSKSVLFFRAENNRVQAFCLNPVFVDAVRCASPERPCDSAQGYVTRIRQFSTFCPEQPQLSPTESNWHRDCFTAYRCHEMKAGP